MTNNRYVVLNCPTLMGNRLCYSKVIKQCADCTDCLIKQIVEKCKTIKAINKRNTYVGEYIEFKEINPLADEILNLLDIQEIEE